MKRRDNKSEIIRQSYELFRERGFNEVSIQDICDACDITKPTFYNHIPSKEHLLGYFFSSMSQEIPQSWYEIHEEEDPLEKIRTGFLLYIDRFDRLGLDLYNEVFIANLMINKDTSQDNNPFIKMICELIVQAQKLGEIKNPTPADRLASTAVGMSVGYGAYWCLNYGKNDLRADLIQGLDALFMIEEGQNGQQAAAANSGHSN